MSYLLVTLRPSLVRSCARALVRVSLFSTVKETLVWSQRGAEATFGGVSGVQPLG